MTPATKARQQIDRKLEHAGWLRLGQPKAKTVHSGLAVRDEHRRS